MWKRAKFSLAVIVPAAFLLLLLSPRPLFSKPRALFIYEGGSSHEASLSEFSRRKYVSFNDIARIYHLSLSFRPVSGKVSLSAYNRRADFIINSDRYSISGVSKRMSHPVRLSRGRAYISSDFLMSDAFADFTETETLSYPDTGTYIVSVRHNVFPARYYTRSDGTRILIGTKDGASLSSSKFAAGRLTLEYPRGRVIEESVSVDDGIVREIRHSNKGRTAVVDIFLSENALTPAVTVSDDGTTVVFVPRSMMSPVVATSSAAEVVAASTDTAASSPDGVPYVAAVPADENVVAADIVKTQAQPSLRPASPSIRKPKTRIVLDAGHGGEDPGAVGPNGTLEKDVNLAIVLELRRLFADDENIEIFLTRSDDTFIPLVDRTNLANEKGADLFISVHCNASMKRTGGGYEVYFLSEKASDMDAMATQILENSVVELEKKKDKKRTKIQELLWSMIVNEFINESSELCYLTTLEIPRRIKVDNRGVKQAGFYVLRGAQMPAILVECAFLSNPVEETKLRNSGYQKRIADGLYVSIKQYLKRKGVAE